MRFGLCTQGRLARPLLEGFLANACEVEWIPEFIPEDLRRFDYLMFYGPMAPIGNIIRLIKSASGLPPVLFWYTEQMPNPQYPSWVVTFLAKARYKSYRFYDEGLMHWLNANPKLRLNLPAMGRFRGIGEMLALHESGLLKLICAFTSTNTQVLAGQGLPVVELPVGYHPFFGEPMKLQRDIDVVFLGTSRDSRRKKMLLNLEEKLTGWNIKLIIKDGSPQRGYIFDHERTVLLNRTKIMLNIMRQPWDDPLYRFLLAASNGVLLLSEPVCADSRGPLKPELHYVECGMDEMVDKLVEYLDDESRRKAITEIASDLISSEFTMNNMVSKCLTLLQ